ncbi:MAG: hypothetical protein K2Q12_00665 [Rickettsiales bacterium]|nr:hypothetical protein [Rickettsiales bacterium]
MNHSKHLMKINFCFLLPIFLLPLAACTSASPYHRASGDPCHLPYLDGKKVFVAAMYAHEGKGKPTQPNWSKKGHRHGAVKLEAPADGFPKNLDVVLVLNSYEPVEWHISPTLAKKTRAVLLAGHYEPHLYGLSPDVPVIEASYEEALAGKEICRPLAALYGKNATQSRYERTKSVVDGLVGLGLDRIGEAKAPEQLFIPSFHRPYVFLK